MFKSTKKFSESRSVGDEHIERMSEERLVKRIYRAEEWMEREEEVDRELDGLMV